MDFSQIQLIYSAEGNANLVVALPQLKKVLRLPKTNISSTRTSKCCEDYPNYQLKRLKRSSIACDESNPNRVVTTPNTDPTQGNCIANDIGDEDKAGEKDEDEDETVSPEDLVTFVDIVSTFIGKEYVNVPEIVRIKSDADRRRINDICRPFRPAHRLDKEFCGQFGLLLPDATLLPEALLHPDLQHQLTPGDTFAVDIKPKQGWMLQDIDVEVCADVNADTSAGCIASVTNTLRSGTPFFNPFNLRASTRCRYCSMQFSKLRDGKISRLSKYCPIDMFSGKPLAMQRALDALLECPQNNLRIFRNGQLIYSDQAGSMKLGELRNLFNGDLATLKDLIISCFLWNYSVKSKEPNGILEKILSIQLLAKDYIRQSYVHETEVITAKRKSFKCLRTFLSRGSAANLKDLTPLEKYLLAATFLDCSIIVAFKEIYPDSHSKLSTHPNIIQLKERVFLTKVTVLDLDPKPDNHFQKYIKNTNQAYAYSEE